LFWPLAGWQSGMLTTFFDSFVTIPGQSSTYTADLQSHPEAGHKSDAADL